MRLTETFRAGFAPEGSDHLSIWDFLADPDQRSQLGWVLEGKLVRADLALPSAMGSVAAAAEAVFDAAVMRHALLTVASTAPDPDPRSGADTLLTDPSLDGSQAIIWIKDLGGRYLRINRRYTERLRIDDASIKGKSDAELSPAMVVDGPRLLRRRGDSAEPLQLEYTVDAFDGREALTVLRFPLHGLDGKPVAVCGVAASVADAFIARSEAERLLRLERWAGLSAAAIRAELIQEWELAEIASMDSVSDPAPSVNGEQAAEATAELERLREEVATARAMTAELEARLAQGHAANAELEARRAEESVRSVQLQAALAAAADRTAELVNGEESESSERAELEAALAAARTRAEAAEGEVAAALARAEVAEGSVAAERARAEGSEREAVAARARVQGAAREVAAVRARMAELKSAQATATNATHQDGPRRAELERRLAEAQGLAEQAERSFAAERTDAAQAHGELVARAEQAEAALSDLRASGERAGGAAKRAEAAAELSRNRAEGLESALASARQVEAENTAALDQAGAEIVSLQRTLEETRAEADTALKTAREAAEQLARERRELADRPPVSPAASAPLARPPSVLIAGAAGAGAAPARSGPGWSHSAQRALTSTLADAAEWRTGLKDALRILGTQGGWDAAVAWCPDERAHALRCVAMWMATPDQQGVFETVTWQRRLSPAASQAGLAAAGDHALWLGDLSAVDDAQLKAAAGQGMRAALLVPIRPGGETSGALELLTRALGPVDPETASAMEAVALQLAHFDHLLRLGAEPRWRLGRV